MNEIEKESWKNISYQCYRKYEYLVDKLALLQSETNRNNNNDI